MAAELAISFAAGLAGFLSPCCLPLLPGYVGYMTGAGTSEKVSVRQALPGSLAFVGGLSLVFVSLGAGASAISEILSDYRGTIERVSGLFIIVLGLIMAGGAWFPSFAPMRFFLRERRAHLKAGAGPVQTFALGAAFAFGWTPCIGPTLGAALNLAATTEGLSRGVALLGAYSLGIGLPFLAAGLGLVRFGGRLKRYSLTIQAVGGLLLVAVGALVFTGRLTLITLWAQRVLTRANLDFWNI